MFVLMNFGCSLQTEKFQKTNVKEEPTVKLENNDEDESEGGAIALSQDFVVWRLEHFSNLQIFKLVIVIARFAILCRLRNPLLL